MYPSTTDNERTEARLVRLTKVWLKGPVRAKEEAFHALMNFGHPKALTVVREVVTHRSSRLRDYAVDYKYATGEPISEESKAILTLSDPKWTNRCSAAQLLKGVRTPSGKRALLARYKLEKHPIVRRDIACALGYWNERKIVDFLRIALTKETQLFGRIGCLEGLVRCGEREFIGEYLDLLDSDDRLVRHQAVNSIGHNDFHPDDKKCVISRLERLIATEDQSAIKAGIAAALHRLSEA